MMATKGDFPMAQVKYEVHKAFYESPLGLLVMVSDGESLVRLDFVRDAENGLGRSLADA